MLSILKGNLTYILPDRLQIDENIVPFHYIQNQVIRDQSTHHVTLIGKNELNLTRSQMKALSVKLKQFPNWDKLETLGIGRVQKDNEEVYYYVVVWPVGNLFRRNLGLQSKYLHVTLGFKYVDIHNVNKGITTLLKGTIRPEIVSFLSSIYRKTIDSDEQMYKEFLDILNLVSDNCDSMNFKDRTLLLTLRSKIYYRLKQIENSLEDCLELEKINPNDFDNRLRISHLYNIQDKIYTALNRYKDILDDIEVSEEHIEKALDGVNLCHKKMRTIVNPRVRHVVEFDNRSVRLSRNFSWVIPDKLAGISIPKKEEEIDAFEYMNIGLIVSVLEEEKLPKKWFKNRNIRNIHYKVKNYHPPSFEEMVEIINQMENTIRDGKGVVVHCGGGKGRAGTVLACFVLKNGLDGDVCNLTPHKTGKAAIELIRELRPGSIETNRQEDFIKEYGNYLWKNMNS